ncbi:MAG: DUF58 domain-containing protein [Sandaracinus sp.]|nr:DUF58 domain-containing protein [Sandaracinus sp.]MCB9636805.1 DUF58 domain-containing protein [Sandaracinus sp.]
MKRLARVGAFARRVADFFPWTLLGLSVGGASALSLWYYAYGKLDLVVLVLGYGAAGLVAMATLFTVVAALALKWVLRRRPPAQNELAFETARFVPTEFRMPAFRFVPLVRTRWTWVTPVDFDVQTELHLGKDREKVRTRARGEHVGVERRIVVEDVFGLTRLALRARDADQRLEVVPHVGKLGRLPRLLAFSGGSDWPHPMGVDEGDRMELRRYAPGDPARFIHWKIFGRTRKLVVRMPERALERAERTVAYLAVGDHDEASAAAARVAVESGALGDDWSFSTDGAGSTGRVPDARMAIVRSAGHRATGGAGLERFVREEERRGPVSLVVFVPAAPGPWLERVLPTLTARRGRARVVVGVDGLASVTTPSIVKRALMRRRAPESTPAEGLEQVLAALAGARADVVVVDRESGRVLTDAHRRAVAAPDAAKGAKKKNTPKKEAA